eukprot:3912629-Rhodomonas_salina.1
MHIPRALTVTPMMPTAMITAAFFFKSSSCSSPRSASSCASLRYARRCCRREEKERGGGDDGAGKGIRGEGYIVFTQTTELLDGFQADHEANGEKKARVRQGPHYLRSFPAGANISTFELATKSRREKTHHP